MTARARPKREPRVSSDPWGLSDHPAGNTASAAWADALAAAWGAITKYPDQHETSWICAHADSGGIAVHWLESGQDCSRPEPARTPYRGRVLLPPKLHEAREAVGRTPKAREAEDREADDQGQADVPVYPAGADELWHAMAANEHGQDPLAVAADVRQLGPVVRAVPETAEAEAAQAWLESCPLTWPPADAEVREGLTKVVHRMIDEHGAVVDADPHHHPDGLVGVRSGDLDTALSVAILALDEADQETAPPPPVLSIVRDPEREPGPRGLDAEMEAGG